MRIGNPESSALTLNASSYELSSSPEVNVWVDRLWSIVLKEPSSCCQPFLCFRGPEMDRVSNGAPQFVFQHSSHNGSQRKVRHEVPLTLKYVFMAILSWCPFSFRFLMNLEIRLGQSVLISQLEDIVLQHCPEFQRLYVPYVTNMMYQEALVNQLLWVFPGALQPQCFIQLIQSHPAFLLDSRTDTSTLQWRGLRVTRFAKDKASNRSSSFPSRELLVLNSSSR